MVIWLSRHPSLQTARAYTLRCALGGVTNCAAGAHSLGPDSENARTLMKRLRSTTVAQTLAGGKTMMINALEHLPCLMK